MYEFWYNYVKTKYGEKEKLHYLDTNSYFLYIKTYDIYKYVAEHAETRFETSSDKLDKPFPKGKKLEINWINTSRVRRKDHDKTCRTNCKNLYLLNR